MVRTCVVKVVQEKEEKRDREAIVEWIIELQSRTRLRIRSRSNHRERKENESRGPRRNRVIVGTRSNGNYRRKRMDEIDVFDTSSSKQIERNCTLPFRDGFKFNYDFLPMLGFSLFFFRVTCVRMERHCTR